MADGVLVDMVGIWVDPLLSVKSRVPSSLSVIDGVRRTETELTRQVCESFNMPPFDHHDLSIAITPHVSNYNQLISTTGTKQFRVLVSPKGGTAAHSRIRNHLQQSADKIQGLADQVNGLETQVNGLIQLIPDAAAESSTSQGTSKKKKKGKKSKTGLTLQQQMEKMGTRLDETIKELHETKEELRETKEELHEAKEERERDKKAMKGTLDETNKLLYKTTQELHETKEELRETKEELRETKEELRETKEDLKWVTRSITPIQLRNLFEYSQNRILEHMPGEYRSWEEFCRTHRGLSEQLGIIKSAVANHPFCPAEDVIRFLCTDSNVRKEGNIAAHEAGVDELRWAVKSQSQTLNHLYFKALFEFVFDEVL